MNEIISSPERHDAAQDRGEKFIRTLIFCMHARDRPIEKATHRINCVKITQKSTCEQDKNQQTVTCQYWGPVDPLPSVLEYGENSVIVAIQRFPKGEQY